MRISSEKDFAKHVESETLYGGYVLYGSQTHLIRHYQDALIRKAVGTLEEPMNLHRFTDDRLDMEQFYNAVEMLPFFAEHRCVTLEIYGDKVDKSAAEELGKILSAVPATTTVIVSILGEEIKKEVLKPMLQGCEKTGAAVELGERSSADMQRFLRHQAKERGCQLTGELAKYLMERCGTDMQQLMGELDKLCAYCGKGEITREQVREVAAPMMSARVFDLSKAILGGRSDEAMGIADALRRQQEPAPMVMAVLCGAFADLYRGQMVRTYGVPLSQAAEALHYPKNRAFVLKYAVNDSKKIPKARYKAVLETLAEADQRIKSTGIDAWTVVEETVLRLLVLIKQ